MVGQAEFDIAQAIQRMRRKPGFGWRKEINALAQYVKKGERVRSMFRVQHADDLGLLALTNDRLIFVTNIWGHKFADWRLADVKSAVPSKGFLSGGCDIYFQSGPRVEFRDMDRQEAIDLATALTR